MKVFMFFMVRVLKTKVFALAVLGVCMVGTVGFIGTSPSPARAQTPTEPTPPEEVEDASGPTPQTQAMSLKSLNTNPHSKVISGSFTGKQNQRLALSATLQGQSKSVPLPKRNLQFRFRWYKHHYKFGQWDAIAQGITGTDGVATASIRIPKSILEKGEKVGTRMVQVWFDGDLQPVGGLQYRGSFKNVHLTVSQ